jgi:glycosyltransferase involved in cell wall biosynthesis
VLNSKLTIFIPTYNRQYYLDLTLNDLFNELIKSDLTQDISILVGDNGSSDRTSEVCEEYFTRAKPLQINFNYFRNDSNLGFSRNLGKGLSNFESEFILFYADDDKLISNSLKEYVEQIILYSPDFSICNFNQPPYDLSNPLHLHSEVHSEVISLDLLSSFVSWPKLTGVCVKRSKIVDVHETLIRISNSNGAFPHVLFGIHILSQNAIFLKSNVFLGENYSNYQEKVNFVPYVGEYLRLELMWYENNFSTPLKNAWSLVKTENILGVSIDYLYAELFQGSILSENVRHELQENISLAVRGKRINSQGLILKFPSIRQCTKLLILCFFRLLHTIKKQLRQV